MKKITIGVLTLIIALVGLLAIIKNDADTAYINAIIKTESYSYLSNPAKEYIKDVYVKTKKVVLTEKNKKDNEPYLNPQYISYLSLSSEEKKEVEVIPNTYVVDYKYKDITESYPSSYDLRNVGGKVYVSPMKNQETLGICWAFAASEQAESYLLKEGGESYQDNPILLSPRQIDYATSYDGITAYDNEYGYRALTTGGNSLLATQVMANGVSLFNESALPFNLQTDTKSLNEVLNYNYSNYEVNSTVEVPNLTNIEDETLLNNYISTLKGIIYNYGGAIISSQDPQGSCGTTNSDGKLIVRADDSCATSIAHDMQIIGWDDNYEYSYCKNNSFHSQYNSFCSNPVHGTGAWIVRNSWGTDVDSKYQYLYIAYDSNTYYVAAATDIEPMSNRTWDRNYVEKPYISNSNTISYYITSSYTAAFNKFVGPREKLEKIKFTTISSDGTYKINVTTDSSNNHEISETINTTHPGLYTVDLSSYNITFDNSIAVTVYSTNSGSLLYRGINVFTSYQNSNKDIKTADLNINLSDEDYYDFDDVYIYSATANIPSNSTITYELYDDEENDLTSHITGLTDNIVAHNDVLAKMSLNNMQAGHYTLRLKYNDQSFDANINLIKQPSIIYHKNYGNDETKSTAVERNVETNLEANTFVRIGYIFTGWNTMSDGSGISYADGQAVTLNEDLNLYAQWTPITYKVVFHSNNGLEETVEQTFAYDESKALTLNTFEYDQYEFNHWAVCESDGLPNYDDGEVVNNLTSQNNGIVNLYAIWASPVVISFDANGGTGDMPNQLVKKYNSANLNANTFTRTGYKFDSWNTEADGTGYSYLDGDNVYITVDTTLYAQWTPITYKVVFHSNNGLDETLEQILTYDTNANLHSNIFSYSGYTFSYWASDNAGSEQHYINGELVSNLSSVDNDSVHLYAIWDEKMITITFDPNGGTGEMNNQVIQALTDTMLNNNTYTRTGYTFKGWSNYEDGSGLILLDGGEINTSDDITLYAQWLPISYSVAFMQGNTEIGTYNLTYDLEFNLSNVSVSKFGYIFEEWNTQADGTGETYLQNAMIKNLTTIENTSVTLYAIFSPITYTITYDANGGIGTMEADEVVYDTELVLKDNTFTKEGCTFAGWNTSANGSGTSYQNKQVVINLTGDNNANIVLYAQWTEETPYVVDKYDYEDNGNYISGIDAITTIEDYEKNIKLANGYTVNVDYKTIDNKNVLYTGAKTRIYKNQVLYKEITNIVSGDTNGDGKINYLDYVNVYNHIQKVKHPETNKKLLTGIYAQAGDMSNDDKISYLDYVRIYNKIKQLKGGSN